MRRHALLVLVGFGTAVLVAVQALRASDTPKPEPPVELQAPTARPASERAPAVEGESGTREHGGARNVDESGDDGDDARAGDRREDEPDEAPSGNDDLSPDSSLSAGPGQRDRRNSVGTADDDANDDRDEVELGDADTGDADDSDDD